VRLRNAEGKIISPYLFLEHAKRANLYGNITKIVIHKAFSFFAHKTAEFSINLSLSDILDQNRVDFLLEKMYEYNVGERLTIEVTEGEGIENHPEVISFLTLLKSQGVKIAIDDFGTGYSNFEYLVKLQADFIKIDDSLIKNIHKNAIHKAVVEAIVTFAQKVGMQTVAEFVANEEIYLTCKELGIDYFQGYFWSEPMPLESLTLY
jgi:EAL domain-containing protein (putative c-di-GMP-specific phosphodiesterase class I)